MSEASRPTAVASATGIDKQEPFRIGIVTVGEELKSPALKLSRFAVLLSVASGLFGEIITVPFGRHPVAA
jgi:hypothetical protein